MAALRPEFLLPGHGLPVIGEERVAVALTDTAELLEALVSQTLAVMNGGGRLDEALHSVAIPRQLADRPYLQPVYDEPEFIVRTIWRQYGGWWDGNPATLKPAPERALALELAGLAGGAAVLAARAVELAEAAPPVGSPAGAGPAEAGNAVAGLRVAALRGGEENLRLAGHLAELAWLAAPEDSQVRQARHRVFTIRADRATSTMSGGVYRWAADESLSDSPAPRTDRRSDDDDAGH
jgi:Alkyl sulfatase dimerisation